MRISIEQYYYRGRTEGPPDAEEFAKLRIEGKVLSLSQALMEVEVIE